MLKIGITGGIGSGKSTVCRIFKTLGIPIYDADDTAKWLMQQDRKLVQNIQQLFGEDIYTENGQLNKAKLAQIVFNDKQALKQLEALVHPAVYEHAENWFREQAEQQAPYALKEAALIFESNSWKQLDKVITVFAPKQLRIQRILQRDETTVTQIEARMNKQMPEEEKVKRADFVIYNDEKQLLIPQVMAIHEELLIDN